MDLAGVILAAGEGKRLQTLGSTAFLILENGRTFIENIYFNIFQVNLKPLVIVVNPQNYTKIFSIRSKIDGEIILFCHSESFDKLRTGSAK
jgi:choline kinase